MNRCRFRIGFTLIEMLGVLAIMALLSAGAAISLTGARRSADLQSAIGQIAVADLSSRTLARSRNESVTLSITLANGRLDRSVELSKSLVGQLPTDVKVERVRMQGNTNDFGVFDIPYTSVGCTPSYAVRLATGGGEGQWIVFSGLSGQMLKVNDEDIDAILQEISSSAGPYAD